MMENASFSVFVSASYLGYNRISAPLPTIQCEWIQICPIAVIFFSLHSAKKNNRVTALGGLVRSMQWKQSVNDK